MSLKNADKHNGVSNKGLEFFIKRNLNAYMVSVMSWPGTNKWKVKIHFDKTNTKSYYVQKGNNKLGIQEARYISNEIKQQRPELFL